MTSAGKTLVRASENAAVEVVVAGQFAVRDASGLDLTPKPQKARALLALLALSPGHARSRRWLIGRLWSDRAPEQAMGSLRQALVDLRKALGPHAGIVQADRETVRIVEGSIRVTGDGGGDEFLEGISVRDPGFRTWRDAQQTGVRGTGAPPPAPAQPGDTKDPLIMVGWGTTGAPGTNGAVVSEIVASRIARNLAEQVPAATMSVPREQLMPSGTPDIDVTCNIIEDDGICLAFLKVTHFPTGRVLYAKDARFVGTALSLLDSEAIERAIFEAVERTAGHIPHVMGASRAVTQSTALGQLALHKMFSFKGDQLTEADRLLAQAYTLHESSVFLAWRALLQMIRAIELPHGSGGEVRDMAEALTRYATERNPGNSTVNALAAQTRAMMFGDGGGAAQFAQRAVDDNPGSPIAMQAMAMAKMLGGEDEAAYQLSARARNFAANSAFRYWWDAHHCTVCVATGRKDEAVRTAEAALQQASSLRPLYRYLIALYADRDDLARAEQMKMRLEALEPGFTLDRMLSDPDYPVRTLRRAGLIGAVRRLL